MPLESQGVYHFHPPSKKLAKAFLSILFSFIGVAYTAMALNGADLLAEIGYGTISTLFFLTTVAILYNAALKQSLTIDCEAGTYTLTNRRFSRTRVRQGNAGDLDILLMKSYNGHGDSIWIRDRGENWRLLTWTEVSPRSSREKAEELADKLGVRVSELW